MIDRDLAETVSPDKTGCGDVHKGNNVLDTTLHPAFSQAVWRNPVAFYSRCVPTTDLCAPLKGTPVHTIPGGPQLLSSLTASRRQLFFLYSLVAQTFSTLFSILFVDGISR